MGYAILKRWPIKENKKRGVEGRGLWYCPIAETNVDFFNWAEEGGWIVHPFCGGPLMKKQNDDIAEICKKFLDSSDLEMEIKF